MSPAIEHLDCNSGLDHGEAFLVKDILPAIFRASYNALAFVTATASE